MKFKLQRTTTLLALGILALPTIMEVTTSVQIVHAATPDSRITTNTARGKLGTAPWELTSEGILFIGAGTFIDTGSDSASPWDRYKDQVIKVIFKGRVIAGSNLSFLFAYMHKIKSIENLNNLDISQTTDMSLMFNDAISLKSLDLSSFDTSNVTTMDWFLDNTPSLSTIKLGPRFSFKNGIISNPISDSIYTGKWVNDKGQHLNDLNIYDGTKVNMPGTWTWEKRVSNQPNPAYNSTVYRLYNKNTGEHFYTTSAFERSILIKVGWNNEGIGWSAPNQGTAVYRIYNPNAKGGNHYYTASKFEANSLVKGGWKWDNEGNPVFYSGGNKPVYVAFNPNATASGSHNFTNNTFEQQFLLKNGWKYGKVQFYSK